MKKVKNILSRLREKIKTSETVEVVYKGTVPDVIIYDPRHLSSNTINATGTTDIAPEIAPTTRYIFQTKEGEEISLSRFDVPENLEEGKTYQVKRNIILGIKSSSGKLII